VFYVGDGITGLDQRQMMAVNIQLLEEKPGEQVPYLYTGNTDGIDSLNTASRSL
jgi:hypothetical protein